MSHDYGEWVFDGETAQTHTKTCANDSSHTLTEDCFFTSTVTTAPTCSQDGLKTYTCTECGGYYTTVIPATGHDYNVGEYDSETKTHSLICANDISHTENVACNFTSEDTTAATCTEDGVRTYTCTECGGSYTEAIPATDHSYGAWTSDNNGKHTRTCTVEGCGATETFDCVADTALDTVTEPTCAQGGYTTHTCEDCGYIWTDTLTAATEDHSYGAWTSDNNGKHTRTCTVEGCGATETFDCVADTALDTVTEPTCAQGGYTTHTCEDCGYIWTDTLTAATEDHSYGAWKSNYDGTHTHICTVEGCGETETANCAYTDLVVPPTMSAQGYTIHTCPLCRYSYIDTYVYLTHKVTFLGKFQEIISEQTVNVGFDATIPNPTIIAGYKFTGWDIDANADEYKNSAEDITVTASYAVADTGHSITVDGKTQSCTQYQLITVTTAATQNGKSFSYWQDENGKIVSYYRTYRFYAHYNTVLTPIYGVAVSGDIATTRVTFSEYAEYYDYLTFYAERSLSNDFTVMQHGILVTSDSTIGTNSEQFNINSGTPEKVLKSTASTTSGLTGLYTLTFDGLDNFGETIYARSYVKVQKDGETYYIYSDIASYNNPDYDGGIAAQAVEMLGAEEMDIEQTEEEPIEEEQTLIEKLFSIIIKILSFVKKYVFMWEV